MKKFMKAIAFATVACMLLSTAVFAANEVSVNSDTKTVEITVADVQKGEQVAIIISNAQSEPYTFTTDTILFVDQKVAESTTVVFEAEITDPSVAAIDIYAGYASNSSASAVQVGNDIAITKETKLTLVEAEVIDDVAAEENFNEAIGKFDPGTKGSVVWLKLYATNIAAGDLENMFWAFHVTNKETNVADTKYVAGDITALGLGSVLKGDVEIAAAFDSTGYKVTGVNAIFKLKGEDVHTATDGQLDEIIADKK